MIDAQSDIELRIEMIREIFQLNYAFSATQENLNLLAKSLEKAEIEYRSVGYEAASVALAVKDFTRGGTLNYWRSFLKGPAAAHAAQVHTGLGWAMAQQRISVSPTIETLEPLMRYRMLDGWGYWNGIFRRRQTLSNQPFPQDVQNVYMRGYDQGVGRSLWYNSKGAYATIPALISGFSVSRHNDLWRGVGLAAAYVGGCNEFILRQLHYLSFPYHTQLSVGAALATNSRNRAGAVTKDIEFVCQLWCDRPAQEVFLITEKAMPSSESDPNEAYLIWLSAIEEQLRVA